MALVSVVESGWCATGLLFAVLVGVLAGGVVSSSEFSVSSISVSGVSVVCQVCGGPYWCWSFLLFVENLFPLPLESRSSAFSL
jgi:hypothetical protein